MDSVGTGKVDADSVAMANDNKQLPVKMNGDTTLETVEFVTKSETTADNKAIYKFYINSEAAQTLIDDAILAGESVAVKVYVTWTNGQSESKNKTFTLDNALLIQLAEDWDNKAVVLTINDLTNVSDLTCTAQVVSGNVVVSA